MDIKEMEQRAGCQIYLSTGVIYISWIKGDDKICLDGDFTVEELEELVEYMKTHKGE